LDESQRIGMVATIVMAVGSVGVCCLGGLFTLVRDANREIPVMEVPPELLAPPPAPAPSVEAPPDPALVGSGRERVGAMDLWTATDAPCPISLPLPDVEVRWGGPDLLGARQPIMPPSPFPYRRSPDADRLYAAMADEVSEPSLYVLELERVSPSPISAHAFAPGHVRGRAFLRAPGVDGSACGREFSASNGELIATGGSEQALQQIENTFALDVELELRLRRAAVESLRVAASAR